MSDADFVGPSKIVFDEAEIERMDSSSSLPVFTYLTRLTSNPYFDFPPKLYQICRSLPPTITTSSHRSPPASACYDIAKRTDTELIASLIDMIIVIPTQHNNLYYDILLPPRIMGSTPRHPRREICQRQMHQNW